MSILPPTKVVFSGLGTLGDFLNGLLGGLLGSTNIIMEIPGTVGAVEATASAALAGLQVDENGALNISGLNTVLSTVGNADLLGGVTSVLTGASLNVGGDLNSAAGSTLSLLGGTANIAHDLGLLGGVTSVADGALLTVGNDLNNASGGLLDIRDATVNVTKDINNTVGTISVVGGGAVLTATNLVNGAAGVIGLGGASQTDLSGNLTNNGTIKTTDAAGATIMAKNIYNNGLIESGIKGGNFNIKATEKVINEATGIIEAVNGGIVNVQQGTFTNAGKVIVSDGGLVNVTGSAVTVGNLQSGVLSGGFWSATGAGSIIDLKGGPITRLSGTTISLSKAGSVLETTSGSTVTKLEKSLNSIAYGASLRVLGSRGYTTTNQIALSGVLQLGGGKLTSGAITAISGSNIQGYGTIASSIASRGRVSASSALHNLTLTGGGSFSGVTAGAGTLDLRRGTFALNTGTVLATGGLSFSGAAVSLDTNLSYKGTFKMNAGTLSLGGSRLGLAGTSTLSGGTIQGAGSLALSGPATVSGSVHVTGGARLVNTGTVQQSGSLVLGAAAKAAGTLVNAAGAVYNITTDGSILTATGGTGTITNAGTLVKTGGTATSTIAASLTNNGGVSVSSGTLDIAGTVSGAGSFSINNNTALSFDGAVGAGQLVTFGSGSHAGNGLLTLGDAQSFKGTVAGIVAGDTIDLEGFAAGGAKMYFTAGAGSKPDTLKIISGPDRTMFHLDGAFVASSFNLASDGHGGTNITYGVSAHTAPNLAAAHA